MWRGSLLGLLFTSAYFFWLFSKVFGTSYQFRFSSSFSFLLEFHMHTHTDTHTHATTASAFCLPLLFLYHWLLLAGFALLFIYWWFFGCSNICSFCASKYLPYLFSYLKPKFVSNVRSNLGKSTKWEKVLPFHFPHYYLALIHRTLKYSSGSAVYSSKVENGKFCCF